MNDARIDSAIATARAAKEKLDRAHNAESIARDLLHEVLNDVAEARREVSEAHDQLWAVIMGEESNG